MSQQHELPRGLAETQSGLIVPEHALQPVQRNRKTIPFEDFKQMRRGLQKARPHGVQVMFGCTACSQPLVLAVEPTKVELQIPGSTIVVEQKVFDQNEPLLRCGCTDWFVR